MQVRLRQARHIGDELHRRAAEARLGKDGLGRFQDGVFVRLAVGPAAPGFGRLSVGMSFIQAPATEFSLTGWSKRGSLNLTIRSEKIRRKRVMMPRSRQGV